MGHTIVSSDALFSLLVKNENLGVVAGCNFAFSKASAVLENNGGSNNGGFLFNKS